MNRSLRTAVNRVLLCGIVLAGSAVLGVSQTHAQIWSQTASACTPDPTSPAFAFNGPRLLYSGAVLGTITARCNVANPLDAPGGLAWGIFDMTYYDPDGPGAGYRVQAFLYRAPIASATAVLVATLDSNTSAVVGLNTLSLPFAHVFDYVNNTYFVTVQLSRAAGIASPFIASIRLR
jgi:hypothetical protein